MSARIYRSQEYRGPYILITLVLYWRGREKKTEQGDDVYVRHVDMDEGGAKGCLPGVAYGMGGGRARID